VLTGTLYKNKTSHHHTF